MERKKAAWEELTAIEKQFSNFRERFGSNTVRFLQTIAKH